MFCSLSGVCPSINQVCSIKRASPNDRQFFGCKSDNRKNVTLFRNSWSGNFDINTVAAVKSTVVHIFSDNQLLGFILTYFNPPDESTNQDIINDDFEIQVLTPVGRQHGLGTNMTGQLLFL